MGESKAIGIRVDKGIIDRIGRRANRKGWTFNKWVNWAIAQGLRSHVRKNGKPSPEST